MTLKRLRVGSTTGQENYLFTAGDRVAAQGSADAGKYYRFVVTDPAATVHSSSSCARSTGGVGDSYLVGAGDPLSTATAWRYELQQFDTAGCPGAPTKTASLYFDVTRASAYADPALTIPKSVFGSAATAYVKLAGVGKVKASPANTSVSDWSTTWLVPAGVGACANTGGGDRPDATSAGVFPNSGVGTDPFLQYRPNLSSVPDSTPWNLEANYETRPCPALAAANEGQWRLRIKRDNTHFVTVPAFTVDTTPPDTTLSNVFAGPTGSTSASFGFTANESGGSFECRLDGGGWTPCSSPQNYSSLSSTTHTFDVRAIDAAGNVDPTPATTSWTVDTSLPVVTLDNPADGLTTSDPTPTLSGSAGNAAGDAATVSVKVFSGTGTSGSPVEQLSATRSGSSWSVDAAPELPDGVYTAYASQEDAASNTGFSSAHTFTVDSTPPLVSLIDPAAGSATSDTTPTFAGGAGAAPGDSDTVTVKLYSGSSATGSPLQTLTATRSGGAWSVAPATDLTEGIYTAIASQEDAANNVGSSSQHVFTVDTTAPTSSIVSGPGATTSSTSASFRFRSSESGSSFECRLDGSSWGVCSSPKSYSGLAAGAHTFEVRAVDAAGNVEDTPSSRSWTIDLSLPNIVLDLPADGSSTNDTTPLLSGSAGMAAGDSATVTVKIVDGVTGSPVQTRTATRLADGSWSVAASPALAEGSYVAWAEQAGSTGTGISGGHAFSVDGSAPNTTITSGPQSATASTSASFTFTSSEAGSSFECRLGAGAWTPCSSPQAYNGLSSGSHTFSVRAIDAAGNADPSPASQTWTVNPNLPAISLATPADGSATNDVTPSFSGTAGTDAGDSATVSVKIYRPVDGAPDELVQTRTATRSSGDGSFSVQAFPALAEGPYIVHAEQVGLAGTGTSGSRSFRIDSTPPRTALTLAPAGTTPSTDARFGFSSSEAGSSFECRLDGGAWEACSSPKTYSGLSADTHTFEARAIDAAGNVDPSPASASWTVDPTAPAITLLTPADDLFTSDTTPQFSGTAGIAAGDSDTVTVEIYLGSSTAGEPVETLTTTRSLVDGSWSVSASPALAEGSYITFASQEDAAANVAYSSGHSFTVDTSAPQLSLAHPLAGSVTNDRTPQLSGAAGTEAGDSSTLTVRLYAGTGTGGSPLQTLSATRSGGTWAVDAATLPDGTYTATAEQADAAGNGKTTPGRSFRVDATAPETTISSGPSGSVTSRSASFSFSSSESGSQLQCRLDGAGWASCSSPKSYSNLALGTHNFQVRAVDAAGNTDPTPAARGWRVVASTLKSAPAAPRPVVAPLLRLTLRAPARQKSLRRGKLRLFATCSGPCTLTLRMRVKISAPRKGGRAKRLKLRKLRVQLLAGKRRKLTLKLSKRLRKTLLRALGQRRRVTLTARARAQGTGASASKRISRRLRR